MGRALVKIKSGRAELARAAVKMKSGRDEVGSARPIPARPLSIFTSARPTFARPLLILTSARPTFARPRLIFTGARPTSSSQPHSLLPGKFQGWNVDVQRGTGQGYRWKVDVSTVCRYRCPAQHCTSTFHLYRRPANVVWHALPFSLFPTVRGSFGPSVKYRVDGRRWAGHRLKIESGRPKLDRACKAGHRR